MEKNPRIIMTKEDIHHALQKLSQQILVENAPVNDLALVGIRSKGVELARRMIKLIRHISGVSLPLGVIDTTLYRDDLSSSSYKPVLKKTEIDFLNKHYKTMQRTMLRYAIEKFSDTERKYYLKKTV